MGRLGLLAFKFRLSFFKKSRHAFLLVSTVEAIVKYRPLTFEAIRQHGFLCWNRISRIHDEHGDAGVRQQSTYGGSAVDDG